MALHRLSLFTYFFLTVFGLVPSAQTKEATVHARACPPSPKCETLPTPLGGSGAGSQHAEAATKAARSSAPRTRSPSASPVASSPPDPTFGKLASSTCPRHGSRPAFRSLCPQHHPARPGFTKSSMTATGQCALSIRAMSVSTRDAVTIGLIACRASPDPSKRSRCAAAKSRWPFALAR